MKKLLVVLAFVGLAVYVNAQETVVPTQKYSVATNSFWSNWFITAGGDYNVFYSDQERGLDFVQSPFKNFRRTWGFGVGVGKWFTPGLGLRTKFTGLWGKTTYPNAEGKHAGEEYDMWNINEQVMFNLSNMLCGYNAKRVWNVIPYVGAGVARNMSYDCYAMDLQVGIMNTWRLCKRVDLFLDVTATMLEGKSDAIATGRQALFTSTDKIITAEAGVKFNLGKSTWEKTPDVDALMALNKEQLDALNASLKAQQDENARLKALLAAKKETTKVETVVKKELVGTKASVFFNIGKSYVASKKDLVNVKEIAEYAKANGSKVVVSGYADSKTGSAAFNQKLSEKRANTVADVLVKYGVCRDNIVVKGFGGVKELSPISYNRRATVELQ